MRPASRAPRLSRARSSMRATLHAQQPPRGARTRGNVMKRACFRGLQGRLGVGYCTGAKAGAVEMIVVRSRCCGLRRRSYGGRDSLRAVLNARMNGTSRDGGERCEPSRVAHAEQTVAVAVERLAVGSLRIVLVLIVLAALADTVLAVLDHVDVPLLLAGAAMTGVALAGVVWPRRTASLLRPRGRVVLVAALFSLLGVLVPGVYSGYGDVEMTVGCLAAVLASPGWVAGCVAVLATGAILDPVAAGGHSLAGAGGGTLAGEMAGVCASAALTLGAIRALRRSIVTAPESLVAVRHGGRSLTPQLVAAATMTPAGLLARADPVALVVPLSVAERRVLGLLADGLAPKQAAHHLDLALTTVRSQIASAKRKTGARTLEQLVGLYAEANVDDA
jgi:DNA-binding CsgD family transcriptional regulator